MSIFKHSKLDIVLVLQTCFHLSLIILSAFYFDHMHVGLIVILFMLHVHLVCANYQSVGHQFVHNRFFNSELLNGLYSVVNSASLGLPSELYRMHHLNHHKGNNDMRGDDGETVDLTSFYRFAKNNQVEGVISYSFKSLVRLGVKGHYDQLKSKRLVNTEIVFLVIFYLLMAYVSFAAFIVFGLIGTICGVVLSYAHNYAEHYGADPYDRNKNSVSCYGKIYNFFFYNNGYHQEHHRFPGVHWTKIKYYKEKLPDIQERKICKHSHLHNLFDKFSNKPDFT